MLTSMFAGSLELESYLSCESVLALQLAITASVDEKRFRTRRAVDMNGGSV